MHFLHLGDGDFLEVLSSVDSNSTRICPSTVLPVFGVDDFLTDSGLFPLYNEKQVEEESFAGGMDL